MKLWDVLIRCLFLLSTVSTNPLFPSLPSANRPLERFPDIPLPRAEAPRSKSHTESVRPRGPFISEPYAMAGPSYPEKQDDVMGFIAATIRRLRRSSDWDGSSWARKERERQRRAGNGKRRGRGGNRKGRGQRGGGGGSHGGKGGRGRSRGCVLKQIHLNVTDLGLGYRTKEELIFRYCSGPCIDSETNYDKILNNLTHNKKLDQEKPSRTCCRPIAFDDDLSFLDDNLVYHTLKKHSARKCGCV